MANRKFKGKAIVETGFILPLVLPPTVVEFLLIIIFGRNSLIGQLIDWIFKQPVIFRWWAAVIAATVVAFPLMYQSVVTGFEAINEDIEGAARVDGANEFKLFIYVSIPLALRAIISGAILSFARALGEFGATLMFAGNIPGKTQTIQKNHIVSHGEIVELYSSQNVLYYINTSTIFRILKHLSFKIINNKRKRRQKNA